MMGAETIEAGVRVGLFTAGGRAWLTLGTTMGADTMEAVGTRFGLLASDGGV